MCVITTAEAGSMPTIVQLAAMSEINPDGAGIAWYDGTTLHRYRNLDNNKTLGKIFSNYQYFTSVPFLLHFRHATHGGIRETNTHPFHYEIDGERGYIAHNGIAEDYTTGLYGCDSRNVIQAWQEHHADITTGKQGKFASINDNGVIRWHHGQEIVRGAKGSILVSNHKWEKAVNLVLDEAA
ncbi:MAG: class II glutamine amidotransferase [Bifidobacterium sp.]|nr:class II glutamine amidotransferase [Bifidobacterium sp.]